MDIYGYIRTYMDIYTQPFAAVSQLPAAPQTFQTNATPEFGDHVYCQWILAPCCFVSRSEVSDQKTMPARRSSEFSANGFAILLLIVFQSMTCLVLTGNIEAWPECQHAQAITYHVNTCPRSI